MQTLKITSLLIALLLYPCLLKAYDERFLLEAKKQHLEQNIILNQEWVKYPDYSDRVAWDKLLGEQKNDIIKNGEQYLDYVWQVVPAMSYVEFEISGSRKIMENPFNSNRKAIFSLFMAELAEGKGRFRDQLINGVFHTCEMTSWVLSAHLRYQKNRRTLPRNSEHVIDLASAEVSGVFSWIYYFMHDEFDKVDPTLSERLKDEIYKKVLNPYMENDYWWMATNATKTTSVNNWNVWCNTNVLLSFALIENDKNKLVKAVSKTMTSVDKFLNYAKSDGACEEGPSYWPHAAGKMFDYLEILKDITKGQISIFDNPMIKSMGEYISRTYVGDNWVVNFADASAKSNPDNNLIYRYGKAVNSNEMLQLAHFLTSKNESDKYWVSDAYRTFKDLEIYSELRENREEWTKPDITWYPKTEFCYMKKGDWFLATKGGFNAESHNHNDVGTFILYVNNKPVFIDAGVGTYVRQTFGAERYTIWTMQSDYHNLPKINGYSQKYGRAYKSTNTKFDENRMMFSTDLANAYEKESGINSWVRTYTLKEKELEIEEKFSLKKASEANEINYMTAGNVDISKKGIISITVEGQTIDLKYAGNNFTPYITEIELDDPRLSNVWGNKLYRISLKANKLMKNGTYKFTIE